MALWRSQVRSLSAPPSNNLQVFSGFPTITNERNGFSLAQMCLTVSHSVLLMQDSDTPRTATKRQQREGGMQIIPCLVRGERRFKIDTFTGGKHKRQFFRTEARAAAALKDAQKDMAALG